MGQVFARSISHNSLCGDAAYTRRVLQDGPLAYALLCVVLKA